MSSAQLATFRVLAFFGISAMSVFAQTAQLTGTVSDQSGSVVPGAKVTATNVDTGVARNSISNESGSYLITALLPGNYRVTTEVAGLCEKRGINCV